MSEEDLIRFQFQNILDKLVGSKIQPTATAIISARQPMVQLFEELMYKLDKLQKENKELKDEIELHKADENTLQDLIREDEENINKLINYIAVRENKDYEDIRKEFDI